MRRMYGFSSATLTASEILREDSRVSANAIEHLIEDRSLPADIEAEKVILGAVLLNNDLLAEVEDLLAASDFHFDAHHRLLDSMMNLARQGMAIDLVTLAAGQVQKQICRASCSRADYGTGQRAQQQRQAA